MDIFWKGEKIGKLKDAVPDMWYLEGTWISDNSMLSMEFEELAKTLNWSDVNSDPTCSTRVEIINELKQGEKTHAVVYGLTDNKLNVRRVYNQEGIDWVLKNIN